MNEMSDVRKRIRNRRKREETSAPLFFRIFYKTLMFAMAVGIFTLVYLVNDKLNLIKIPESFKVGFVKISEWLPFDAWLPSMQEDTESVAALPTYSLLEAHKYANGTNQANILADGVVLHVEEKDASQSSVTVRHDNGVIVTYGHLNQVMVKQDERLKKGDVAGNFEGYVTLDMVKNQQSVDLQTALMP